MEKSNHPYQKGLYWYRILGYLIVVKDLRYQRLYFAERNNLVKGLHFLTIKNWRISWRKE